MSEEYEFRSGAHKGKKIRQLTTPQLRQVWASTSSDNMEKRTDEYVNVYNALRERENSSANCNLHVNVFKLLNMCAREVAGFMLAREKDTWVVTGDEIDGWLTDKLLPEVLRKALKRVTESRPPIKRR